MKVPGLSNDPQRRTSPYDDMDYSVLENKIGKENSETIKLFDDMVLKERPDLRPGWEERRKREIENFKREKELPGPGNSPAMWGVSDNTPASASQTDLMMAGAIMHEQGRIKIAGDVLPLQIMNAGTNTGPTPKAADYAVGKIKDPKIEPMPIGTTKDWADRMSKVRR